LQKLEYLVPDPKINPRYGDHDKEELLFCPRRSYFSWIRGKNNKQSLEMMYSFFDYLYFYKEQDNLSCGDQVFMIKK